MFANTPATLEISYANPLPEPVKDCVLLVTLMGQAIKIKYVGLDGGGGGITGRPLLGNCPARAKGGTSHPPTHPEHKAGDCGAEPSATPSTVPIWLSADGALSSSPAAGEEKPALSQSDPSHQRLPHYPSLPSPSHPLLLQRGRSGSRGAVEDLL